MLWVALAVIVLAAVLWYWLRRLTRAMVAFAAVVEATVNRAAKLRGDKPVSDDIDLKTLF